MAKPKERTLNRPEEAPSPERFQLGIVSEISSEWWAISFRNRGRFKIGMVGDFARNQQSASQLFTWRRLAREDRLSGDAVPALIPLEIAFTPAPASTRTPQPPSSPPAQRARVGIIEIELSGGCRVRVDRDVDAEALQRVLELMRRQ